MGFFQQTWTLTKKNLLIVLYRHWLSTTVRAFLAPIIYIFFISYSKNFFIPPSNFGIGTPSPVRTLPEAFNVGIASRYTVAFVNNGYTGGQIDTVINDVAAMARSSGKQVQILNNSDDLLTTCKNSLRGVSHCFAAATFHSSPTQGPGGIWNYTIFADGALGEKIFVDVNTNDQEVYVLPFQRAIDQAIATNNGSSVPVTEEYPFTDETNVERSRKIVRLYQGALIKILALTYFIGIVGVTYQLVGQMATERELGISQLIEAMMPNKRRWQPQVARILSNHLSFDIIYFPGWLIMGLIVAPLVFPQSSVGVVIGLHLLGGLSLTSYSIFAGSFFRKAQLSGITVVIVSLVLAIIAQLGTGPNASTGTVGTLSLLFPPMTYTYFIIYIASWQQKSLPPNLSEYAPSRPWQITGAAFFGFFAIQILVLPILGALVERSLYGTASTDRKVTHNVEASPVSVKLTNFSKHFGPSWFARKVLCGRKKKQVVKAVDDVTLDIRQGQIMILLGANGSGKSTTLDAVCGLSKITSGEIEIDGYGGIGLCPQKNVLWDELTSFEHVQIFNRLKTIERKATKAETEQLIRDCDLDIKMHAKAKTLSGGQKRKLQLACMFTGGSRVCCVDEVSSGIDPLARRKVWDILLAERGRRTIILTTHFLDEADVLSDQIAVLSKGTLRAEGSAVELKHKFGSGYRVFVDDASDWKAESTYDQVSRYHDYDQTVYQLDSSAETASFISHLDAVGNQQYRVQGPTVEDVFLRLAEEIKDDFGGLTGAETDSPRSSEIDTTKTPAVKEEAISKDRPMTLLTGQGTGLVKQSWILFQKRCVVLQHNYVPYLAAVLLPIAAAGLVTLFLKGQPRLSCNPASQSSLVDITSLESLISPNIVYGPPNRIPRDLFLGLYPQLNSSSVHTVDTLEEFQAFVSANFSTIIPGGFFIPDTGAPVFAYLGEYDMSWSVLIQNYLDAYLSGQPIQTGYSSFATPFSPQAGNTLQVILYFGLAMSAYTGFFALYPNAERIRKVRALHYSNGVRSGPLWIAYAAFDFIFVLIVSVIAIALWTGQWYGFYYPGYLFVVFFLYGLTSIAMAYVISLFATSQLASFAFTAGAQASLYLVYFIAYLCIITYAPVQLINDWVTIAHFTIALITPSGNLLRALLLTFNEFSLLCDGDAIRPYGADILAMGGPILYLLVQFCLLMAFLIWWDSGGRITLFKRSATHAHKDAEYNLSQDPEVVEEIARIDSSNDGLRVLHLNKAFGTNLAVSDITFGIRPGETFALLGPNGAGKSTTISLIRGDLRPSYYASEVFVSGKALMHHRVAARNHLGVCPQFDAIDQMTVLSHLRFYAKARGVPQPEVNVREVMRGVGLTQYANRLAAKLSGGNKRKLSLAIALMGNPSVLLLDEPSSGMDAAAKRVMWRVLGSVTTGRALLITTHSMEEADALAGRAGIMAKHMLALGTTDMLRRRHGDAYYVHLVHKEAPHTSDAEMERIKAWVRANVPNAVLEDRTYHGQLRFSVPNASNATSSSKTGDETSTDESIEIEKADTIARVTRTYGRGGHGVSTLFSLLEGNKEELAFAYYTIVPTTLDQVFLNVVRKNNVLEENYAHEHEGDKVSMWKRVGNRFSKIMSDA